MAKGRVGVLPEKEDAGDVGAAGLCLSHCGTSRGICPTLAESDLRAVDVGAVWLPWLL